MVQKLPDEILSSVATHLSQDKRSTCVRVCRLWYAIFIPTLYESVEIKDEDQFDQFLDSLRTSDTLNPIKPLGHFVCKLGLCPYLSLDQIASLSRLCPFVIEVNCSERWYDPTISDVVQQWKHIKNFGPLRIETGQDISLDVFRNIVTNLIADMIRYPEISKYITELPCIEELTLGFFAFNPGSISLHELETLHMSLPRLRSLKISFFVIDGEMPEQITPCDSVCSLSLSNPKGHLWGQYFARKYKNLKKLSLTCYATASEDTKTEFMALARSCQRLEHFHCNKRSFRDLNQQCMEVFHSIGAPLTYLYFDVTPTVALAKTINNFHETVSKIKINVYEEDKLEIVLEAGRACLHLVDLHLSCICIDLEVGHILDYCQYLKYLVLAGMKIRADSSYATNSQHGLRSLTIDGDMDEGVFPYLSQRCPRIFSLSCGIGIRSPMPYLLYFPSPSLETLRVEFRQARITVFKVTRVSKPEEIVHCNTSVNERQTEDSARWFYKDNDSGKFLVKELEYRQPDPFSDAPRNDYDGQVLSIFPESSQHNDLSDTLKNGNIIRILCHFVDQIYLNDKRVRY